MHSYFFKLSFRPFCGVLLDSNSLSTPYKSEDFAYRLQQPLVVTYNL